MTEPNIFEEVREDYERERLEAAWREYGPWIIAAALLAVLMTAGIGAYRTHRAAQQEKATAAYIAAAKQLDDPAKSMARLQSFANLYPGTAQAAFARLEAGRLALAQGDTQKAVAAFDEVANDGKADPAFRDLGTYFSVAAQLDSGDPRKLSARLDPLTVTGAVWRASAMEAQGYLALRANDKDKAVRIFTELAKEPGVPASIAARAADILRSLKD